MEERAALLRSVNQVESTPRTASSSSRKSSPGSTPDTPAAERQKVYVLDTNVLIHDPNSVLNFDEHRVVIPMTVLEELDKLTLVQLRDGRRIIGVLRAFDQFAQHARYSAVIALSSVIPLTATCSPEAIRTSSERSAGA